MSLFSHVRTRGSPDHVALRKGTTGPSVTYESMADQVKKLASHFSSKTIISSCLDNSIENAIVFLAIGVAGSAIAPLNPDYSQTEFEFFLRRSPGGVVVPKTGNAAAEAAATKIGIPIIYAHCDRDGVVHLCPSNVRTRPNPTVSSEDTALILFTSGTTGQPKAVPLSHGNLIASVGNIVSTYSLTPADTTIAVMPLFHIHGLMASLFATLASGGTVVLPSGGKFGASTFFDELLGNVCTWFTAVPTMHQILLNTKSGSSAIKGHKLRFIRSCSSALAPTLLHQVEERFGVEVIEAYAMTEASHQMTSNPIGGTRKPGTVGRPHGQVDIAIYDGSGNRLSVGVRGEVCVKGPSVTKGYLNNPEANKTAFFGDFFRTGDEGFLDKDGFLTITGRLKELINRGGEKISPIEIDSLLLSHPAVAEAVSFAIPDAKYGEVVGAAVVIKPGQSVDTVTLQKFVRGKAASFKVPIVFVATSLPRTATGKIQRRIVANHFLRSSNL